jgi:hypothetical protein
MKKIWGWIKGFFKPGKRTEYIAILYTALTIASQMGYITPEQLTQIQNILIGMGFYTAASKVSRVTK